ncbi:MAG TPA: four helix bundle protein [Gemmatimonadaceae bacterium]|nr:four helix bundle protein [Gemmatimonadaceae bacterium]
MQDFKRLRVANHARVVIAAVYDFTRTLPRDERFALSSQMRRAALSVGLNIAEGCSRSTTREFIRYLEIARGSAMELEFALLVTSDLKPGTSSRRDHTGKEVISIMKELSALIPSLRCRLSMGTRT